MFIIGNIKIDETRQERIHYFFATLLSYRCFQNYGIGITLNDCSSDLFTKTLRLLTDHFPSFSLASIHAEKLTEYKPPINYRCKQISDRLNYWDAIALHQPNMNKFYITFEEDHFCMMENDAFYTNIEDAFKNRNVDLIRASFNDIEKGSAKDLGHEFTKGFKVFKMDEKNHATFCQRYGYRYFIGTNTIIRTEFAKRFYSRAGTTPHHFELGAYNNEFEYICGIPEIKIMECIDDEHGEPRSNLLAKPTEKFLNCMEQAKLYL